MRKSAILITSFLVLALVLGAVSCGGGEKDVVWSDGQVSIIVDKVEKTNTRPPQIEEAFSSSTVKLPKLADGHKYVSVYVTISRIENVHILDALFLPLLTEKRSTLQDTEGDTYTMQVGQVSPFESSDPGSSDSQREVTEGATCIIVFEIPQNREPASLTLLYSFKETWEATSAELGQVEISELPKCSQVIGR